MIDFLKLALWIFALIVLVCLGFLIIYWACNCSSWLGLLVFPALALAMMNNSLFERLKSIDEECAVVEKKPDGNYHAMYKKRLINDDGSDAGWLYVDIPNARLDEDGRYVIEPPKEDKIGNRAERRYRNNGRQDS